MENVTIIMILFKVFKEAPRQVLPACHPVTELPKE